VSQPTVSPESGSVLTQLLHFAWQNEVIEKSKLYL
jgi:hypothetical protein